MIFKFLLVAIIVFTVYRIISFIIVRINKIFRLKNQISEILSVIELLTWMVFILWVVRVIYVSKNYYVLTSVSILFLLIAVPFFFLIRDFVSGLFLKLQNKLFEGMSIEIEDVKGVVKKNGIFRLDIEDKYGNINSVSYYKIRSKIITRPKVSYNLEKTTLEFIFQEASNTNRILAELKRQLMNIPWVAVRQPPLIENTRVENGKFIVEIGVYMLDKSYAENIKHSVESNMLTM